MIRKLRDTWASILCPVGGLAAATAVIIMVAASQGRLDEGERLVWAALVLASGTAAGAIFVYGLRRWADLTELAPAIGWRAVRWPVARVGLLAVVGINMTGFLPGADQTLPLRALGLLLTAITLSGAPAAGTMYGVGLAASASSSAALADAPDGEPVGVTAHRLVELRELLVRLLETLGGLVLLVTLSQAAQIKLGLYSSRPPSTR